MRPPKLGTQEHQQGEQLQPAEQHTGCQHDFDEIGKQTIILGRTNDAKAGADIAERCGYGADGILGIQAGSRYQQDGHGKG